MNQRITPRYNLNRYTRFPLVSTAALTAVGPVEAALPVGLLLDAEIVFYSGAPAEVILAALVLATDGPGRTLTLRVEHAAGAVISVEVPDGAEDAYTAEMATTDGRVSLIIGRALAEVMAWPDGTYDIGAEFEPALCTFLDRARVTSVAGDYASTPLTGDVYVEDGHNTSVRLLRESNTLVFSAEPGAGLGANCEPLQAPSRLTVLYDGKPAACDTFLFGGFTYTFGPCPDETGAPCAGTPVALQPSTGYPWAGRTGYAVALQGSGPAFWAALAAKLQCYIEANGAPASTPNVASAFTGSATASAGGVELTGATGAITLFANPAAGESCLVFGHTVTFGSTYAASVQIAATLEGTLANLLEHMQARFGSSLVAHVLGYDTLEYTLAPVAVGGAVTPPDEPAGDTVFDFYDVLYWVRPAAFDVALELSAFDTYAAIGSRLAEDFPYITVEHTPGSFSVTGPSSVLAASDFYGVTGAAATLSLNARTTCASSFLWLNGVRADANGDLKITSTAGFSVIPDPDNNRVLLKLGHDPDELACGACGAEE